ncbi:MAG: hypothetical protein LBT55_05135 [Clostridiaceae bacterium]|jgi:4-diphosphocytidyl-2-C-methyl-D-erythritol kinase|nr:hypothetical protein [Clostridiaceae bacterium]
MTEITLNAYAKINIGLNVTGRAGVFHTIDTIMCTVSLCDEITVRKCDGDALSVRTDVPVEGENSALKALRIYTGRYGGGYSVSIKKRIPVGGGLGGSSADAAGVFRALAALNTARQPDRDMLLAAGSDVPFMYACGAARVQGIGERLSPLSLPSTNLMIAVPDFPVSTAAAYAAYDMTGGETADIPLIAEALRSHNINLLKANLKNALYTGASACEPRLKAFSALVASACEPYSAPCSMTGSGSGFVVFANDTDTLNAIASTLKPYAQVFVVRTVG